jgi:methoxymalonate biosynthesis acyl carrier protein
MPTTDSRSTTSNSAEADAIRAPIREFIVQRFANQQLGDHEDIFDLGYVNSLFAMQLVLFVEKTFGIGVESEDLEIDNFRTVAAIGDLVQRRQIGYAGTNGTYRDAA